MSNLANIVECIVSAFQNSLKVFQKVQGRQRPNKVKCAADRHKEELHLRRSMRQGPTDIIREYDRSFSALGDRFATGDGGCA